MSKQLPVTRTMQEAAEAAQLAGFAFVAAHGRGRDHRCDPDPYRTDVQRDHDRIVHSRAFRRLQYKTQVFTNDEGDHFRTRLTHTIEVTQLARAAARRLGLNCDLVECAALIHDIGHPPFGHRGEAMLAELMADHGSFEHNRQALRTVEELESRYPEFPGLNLTYEVREAIVKHGARHDPDRVPLRFHPDEGPLLEAALVDEVDAIAYDCHDLDDGLRSGLLSLDALSGVPLWQAAYDEAIANSPRGTPTKQLIDRAVRQLVDALIGNLADTTAAQLTQHRIATLADVRAARSALVAFSPSMLKAKQELEAWLFEHLYRHWQVNRTLQRARTQLAELFGFYTAHPDCLPPEHAARADGAGLHRAVADYIAGMTDRFAVEEHRRLCG